MMVRLPDSLEGLVHVFCREVSFGIMEMRHNLQTVNTYHFLQPRDRGRLRFKDSLGPLGSQTSFS